MASCKRKYTADDFKKCSKNFADGILSVKVKSKKGKILRVSRARVCKDEEARYIEEDKLISRLYREVVDDIMESNNLRESTVDAAIENIIIEIHQGHKKGFHRFLGIDFCKAENCCGYLRRYAICHTGLVKKMMWKFFKSKYFASQTIKKEILNNRHLKVTALGGGPGNDLVGFCSALQGIPNMVKQLDLVVIDINKGWESVFPIILKKAANTNYGSFSQSLSKEIKTGFMEADLTKSEAFKEFSLPIGQSDILMMVKLTSFLCYKDTDVLIQNVVDSMKPGAILIFIDQPYYAQYFHEMKSLDCRYHDYLEYEMSFNPSRYHSPSISTSQAHIAILQKKIVSDDDSSECEDM